MRIGANYGDQFDKITLKYRHTSSCFAERRCSSSMGYAQNPQEFQLDRYQQEDRDNQIIGMWR